MVSKNTKKLLLYLLKNGDSIGFNINQLARENGISVGSAFKILKDLEQEGLAKRREIGNAANYTLDLDNPETVKLCELLLMIERRELTGAAKLYAEELSKYEGAEIVALFGSVLQKKEFNDIDALFVTDNVRKARAFCMELSSIRTKPVVPLILKREELVQELHNKERTIVEIIKNSAVIKGESEFIGVIKDGRP